MLKNIFIKNIVLIEKLNIKLEKGLIIFSGETGAGKSIILTSISLAIGKRADLSLIRKGEEEGSVVVEFEVSKNYPLLAKLKKDSLENDNQLLIRRTINKDGKSKAFINDNPVTVKYLQEIGNQVIEIHGQNEKVGLLDPSTHLRIMDRFGKYGLLKEKTKNAYEAYTKLQKIYETAIEIDKNKISYIEQLKNKINLINALNMKDKEEEDLLKKRNLMSEYDKVFSCINEIFLILSEENSLLSKLSTNSVKLENIASNSNTIDEINTIIQSLNNVLIESKEIISGINNIKENYNFDQKELEFIEERLFDIHNLAKKLGVQASDIPKLSESISVELESIEKNIDNIEKIKEKLDSTRLFYDKCCKELSLVRKEAAVMLQDNVNSELEPLKLIDAKFRVEITQKNLEKFNADGADNIKFLVKLNKGANEGEIHKISSGGELSRLMLALNLVLSGSLNRKTIIFDEVDAGVSGAVANAVGVRLQTLSNFQQVLVVTHLPQVASRGTQHFRSFKNSNNDHTYSGITELNYDDRVEEIAKMMSGEKITHEAKIMANKLMENS